MSLDPPLTLSGDKVTSAVNDAGNLPTDRDLLPVTPHWCKDGNDTTSYVVIAIIVIRRATVFPNAVIISL